MEQAARHVIFSGHVQGVGFRYTAHRIARRHDVTGFVRNLPDGTVEMFVQGLAHDVEACMDDLNQTMAGYIRKAKVNTLPSDPQYIDFKITF
jgi:acylphosphatase